MHVTLDLITLIAMGIGIFALGWVIGVADHRRILRRAVRGEKD